MAIDPLKAFKQTTSKLRTLWTIATILIGKYEDFERRLTTIEKNNNSLSNQLSDATKRINV
jgi:hypothetical protein